MPGVMAKAINDPHIPPNRAPAVQQMIAHRDLSGTTLALRSKNPVTDSATSTGFLDKTPSSTLLAPDTSRMVLESVTAQDAQEQRYLTLESLLRSVEHLAA